MMRSFSSAVGGLRAHQTAMDVVANNIANVNTSAFKSSRFTFADSLSQVLRSASGATPNRGSSNAQQIGLGATTGSIDNIMSQGAITATGNPFDVAIQGDGFFRVTDTPGFTNINYTRAGNFTTDSNGDLVTQDGWYVVGYDVVAGPPMAPGTTQQKINIPTTARTVNIDSNGLVSYVDDAGTTHYVAYISMAKFPNNAGLQHVGENRWMATASSGAPTNGVAGAGGMGTLTNRALEMSNVDLANEFSEMIKAQRGFQANSRTITAVDDMIQALIQMKR